MILSLFGDVAAQKFSRRQIENIDPELMSSNLIIADLAYPILSKKLKPKRFTLSPIFCSTQTIELLQKMNVDVVSFCTNHSFDFSKEGMDETYNHLKKAGIKYFGSGDNLDDLKKPLLIQKEDQKLALISFSWPVIGGVPATKTKAGILEFKWSNIVSVINNIKNLYPDFLLAVFFHWNYELEAYPQPYHRKIARECIDMGVDLIIGNHTHRFGPIETYRDKLIIYSLGNWFHPSFNIGDFKLRFPNVSLKQCAISVEINGKQIKKVILSHHTWNSDDESLKHVLREELDSKKSEHLINNLSMKTYDRWFEKNRVKNKFLPIYYQNESECSIFLKNLFLKLRTSIIDLLHYFRLKSGPS